MTDKATGTFEIELRPGPPELDGKAQRFDFDKTFHGDLEGTGKGLMVSAGDPTAGAAGYVAIETVRGRLGERHGGFAFQQFGTMQGGEQELHYEVVPGSGQEGLAGISGRLDLSIDPDGTHRYELVYEL
jgi:Protein of unknown function (DUF3224)